MWTPKEASMVPAAIALVLSFASFASFASSASFASFESFESSAVAAVAPRPAPPRFDRRAAPFDGIRWESGEGGARPTPIVRIGATWYRPTSIDGRSVDEILSFIERTWPAADMHRRFAEDLVEAMTRMGAPPGETVRLELVRIDDGVAISIPAEPLTARRRDALRDTGRRRAADARRIAAPPPLDVDGARTALEALREAIDARSSYAALGDQRYRALIDEAIASLPPTIDVAELAWRMRPIVASIGDAHADVRSVGGAPPPFRRLHLPFVMVPLGIRPGTPVAAIRPDRGGPLDALHPLVTAIDGVPLERWLAAASAVVGPIAPQTLRRRACRELGWIEAWRPSVAPDATGRAMARLTVGALDGGAAAEIDVPLAPASPRVGPWPDEESRIIENDIGWLRLARMDDDAVATIDRLMPTFSGTRGLIVDVRGNGGGERGPMRALAGRLLPRDHPPVVINAARPLLVDGRVPAPVAAQMARRGLWPEAHEAWTPAERAAIAAFRTTFRPERSLPDDRFGPWCYCVLSPSPEAVPYDRPVVVLMDAGCFSATDVFLAALKALPGVTLVGQPSGGGSGARLEYKVGDRFVVALSSIVSFQPDGSLFDGRGVTPDVTIAPDLPSQLVGGADAARQAALDLLGRPPIPEP